MMSACADVGTESVAPYTGAWIEIGIDSLSVSILSVAPYTGAWIEMCIPTVSTASPPMSLPTRERGLKFPLVLRLCPELVVAPYTGAWIEITIFF